jgi:D-alanyl-D-alanine carboxypeptidase/D-alanyl-D-alanine-endopeptidase (penicillin-binding protein 4)
MPRFAIAILASACLALSTAAPAQSPSAEERIRAIMARPEYRHSRFGIEFYSINTGKVVYALHAGELFVPGSTTKLLSVGSALELLGPEFRFHTRIYGTTTPDAQGLLSGDLVLLAGGDPNLSGRLRPDETLAFKDEDHSYDGFAEAAPVDGDPLLVIRQLARKVAAKGVKRISGRIVVDASLFPEGARELGTRVVLSPIVVNDNLVDVLATPGAKEGDPASLAISPPTRYLDVINEVKTSAAGEKPDLHWDRDVTAPDGSHRAALRGSVPSGHRPVLRVYKVPGPSVYAGMVLAEELIRAGVEIANDPPDVHPDRKRLARYYVPQYELAEHTSPPLRNAAQVVLKVSQNLHASMLPYLIGAFLDVGTPDPLQGGFDRERALLERAGLDLAGAVQNDGAGGNAMFSPAFMVSFLLHMRSQPFFPAFYAGLPVLGRDGTLAAIQVQSPAAGHVFAKTGTLSAYNSLTHGGIINGKGLAGFIDTRNGTKLAFAAYINFVPVAQLSEEATQAVGQTLGEIAAIAYDAY